MEERGEKRKERIMNQIYYIFILFCLLFIIESKAINILISFVGIMITLAIQLANNQYLLDINGEYISYILILVQVSALTILFGFIIMLYPTLSIIKQKSIFSMVSPVTEKSSKTKYILFSLIFLTLIYSLYAFFELKMNTVIENTQGNILSYYILEKLHLDTIVRYSSPEWSDIILSGDTELLRKLGTSLYTEDNNIIKLILLTVILLLAIIILFFLVNPL